MGKPSTLSRRLTKGAIDRPRGVVGWVSGAVVRVLVGLVWAYRLTLGAVMGGRCRYQPTCSQYMIDALHRYGPIRGTWRGLRRIGRCHPWAKGGYDPA
jgi:hypothetical protein